MPEIIQEKSNNVESCTALWIAVLFQAMQDIVKPKGNAKEKRLYRESALYWINDRDNDNINSFVGICNLVGFDPDKTRAKIMEMKHERGLDVIF